MKKEGSWSENDKRLVKDKPNRYLLVHNILIPKIWLHHFREANYAVKVTIFIINLMVSYVNLYILFPAKALWR